jgi:hypothetical protein
MFNGERRAAWALPSNFADIARRAQAHWHDDDETLREYLEDFIYRRAKAASKNIPAGKIASIWFSTAELLRGCYGRFADSPRALEMRVARILEDQILGVTKTREWGRHSGQRGWRLDFVDGQ